MREERGVSTTIDYVLVLAVSSVLITGLLIAGGSTVADERERVTTDELAVLGGQLAEGYLDVDSLASTGGVENTAVRVTLTERAAGSGYTITVVNESSGTVPYRYDLVLESASAGSSATVTVRTHHQAVPTSVDGGNVVIRLEDPDGDGDSELVLDTGPLTPPMAVLSLPGVDGGLGTPLRGAMI